MGQKPSRHHDVFARRRLAVRSSGPWEVRGAVAFDEIAYGRRIHACQETRLVGAVDSEGETNGDRQRTQTRSPDLASW